MNHDVMTRVSLGIQQLSFLPSKLIKKANTSCFVKAAYLFNWFLFVCFFVLFCLFFFQEAGEGDADKVSHTSLIVPKCPV